MDYFEASMDSIIDSIYPLCDLNKNNSVPVSQLIEFIKPYLTENLLELEVLRSELDPNSINPNITRETFHNTLNRWCNKIKHSMIEQDLENSLSCQIVDKDFSQSQIDIEDISDLKFQLNKTISDFHVVKLQLTSAEEHNELLSSDLSKTLQQLQKSNRRIEEMERYKLENKKLMDEINFANDQINNLQKQSTDYSNERHQLLEKVKRLENEKLCLQNKLGLVQNQEQEIKKQITEMYNVIEMKIMENTTLNEIVEKLKIEVEEQKKLVTSYDKQIQSLKHNNTYLEELLNEPSLINESLENQNLQNLLENIKDTLDNEDCNFLSIDQNLQDRAVQVSNINLKEQENIKKNLWGNLKELRNENDLLKHYKSMCLDLEGKCENQEEIIEKLKNQNQEFNNKVELYRNNSVALQTSYEAMIKERDDLLEKIRILEVNNQSQINMNNRRKGNFSRQELIINKLEERIDNLEADLQLEKDLYRGLLNDYESLLIEKNKNQEEFNKKLDEIKYAHSIELEELNNKYCKEKEDNQFLNNEVICIVDELNELKTSEGSVNNKSRKLMKQSTQLLETIDIKNRIIESLQNNEMNINERLHYFKNKLQEEESNKIELRKQIFDLKSKNSKKISELELCLHRKEIDLANMEKELNQLKHQQISFQQNIDQTLQTFERSVSMIQNLNFGINLENDLNLDHYSTNFQNKIEFTAQLIEMLIIKHQELLRKFEEIDKTGMDDIPNQLVFSSRLDEVLQDFQWTNDDTGYKDIEVKFEKLTSTLTMINLEIENGRFEKQQQHCSLLLRKFRKSLNNCILLLRTNQTTVNTVIAELEQLRTDCCMIFTAAKSLGNLEYVCHVIKQWNLIINYFGILQRQINNLSRPIETEIGHQEEQVITIYEKSKFNRKFCSVCIFLSVPVLFCVLYSYLFTTETC